MSAIDPRIAANASAPAPAGARAYTDLKGLGALKARSGNDPSALKLAAQQFEALFLEMMLKSMRDASLGDGILDSDTGNLYQDMFDKQIALSMSARSQLGIAEMMMRQLSPPTTPAAPAGASGLPLQPGAVAPAIAGQAAAAATARPALGALLAALRGALGASFGLSSADAASAAMEPSTPAAPATSAPIASSPTQFVAKLLPLARRAAAALNVSPLGILAQAALETGWGQRVAKLADGGSAFNLFGIKAGEGWGGKTVGADTIEFTEGVAARRREAFRAYDSAEGSVNDYVQLLKSSPRYGQALAAGQDPHAFAAGLAQGGYATDPNYAKKISDILTGDTLRQALGALKD